MRKKTQCQIWDLFSIS